MTLSGPIVIRSSQPGSTSPVRRPASITASRPSAYVAIRTRSRSAPSANRSAHSRRAAAELEVDDAGHAHRGGGLERALVRRRRGAVVADQRDQPGVRREPLALEDDLVPDRQRERDQGRGVEPGVVAVAADQDHRRLGGDRVELGDGGVAVPAGEPVAPPDDRLVGHLDEPLGDQRGGLLGRPDRAEVEPLRGDGPLAEVDVLVPQAGDQPAALGVVLAHAGQGSRAGPISDDAALDHLRRRRARRDRGRGPSSTSRALRSRKLLMRAFTARGRGRVVRRRARFSWAIRRNETSTGSVSRVPITACAVAPSRVQAAHGLPGRPRRCPAAALTYAFSVSSLNGWPGSVHRRRAPPRGRERGGRPPRSCHRVLADQRGDPRPWTCCAGLDRRLGRELGVRAADRGIQGRARRRRRRPARRRPGRGSMPATSTSARISRSRSHVALVVAGAGRAGRPRRAGAGLRAGST